MSARPQSEASFARAKRVIPGGVNSTVRAFRSVGGTPVVMREGHGARITDVDGNVYLDYVLSWGPLILGHAHPAVVEAITRAAERGTSFGTPTDAESELAELVVRHVPSIEKVRFCSSGTEATANAIRLARGVTGRDAIVKFAGCYHGSADPFLVAAGSSALTIGKPNSAGVPEGTARDTLVAGYNDLAGVRALFAANPGRIAAIIVEPIVGNMGLVVPQSGFLAGLREIAHEDGALLVFDEVMTGWRVARGGVQERAGVLPDITTLGKVVGGGLPVGAFGGSAGVMDHLTPDGDVFQAGTLSGNPLATAAGIATLRALDDPAVYAHFETIGAQLCDGLGRVMAAHGVPHQIARAGSMFGFFLTDAPVHDLTGAKRSDTALYARLFHALLDAGVYIAPSQFEAGFLSLAHQPADIEATLAAFDTALQQAATAAPA